MLGKKATLMSEIIKPQDIIHSYDLFLVDIWGVICEGLSTYPGVVKSLNWMSTQKPLCYVSNSPRLRAGAKGRLDSFGIKTTEDMIYTSGLVMAGMIDDSSNSLGIEEPVIYHLADNKFNDIYLEKNWNFTNDLSKANILLVNTQLEEGDDLTIYDALLDEAAKRGLTCVCPNPDTIIPNGISKTYCPGFFVRNYKGRLVYTGKPHTYIYKAILEKYSHIPKDRILMIGDTLDMDILGAQNVGIQSALVPTGNARLLCEKLGISESDFASIREHIEIQPSILLSLS